MLKNFLVKILGIILGVSSAVTPVHYTTKQTETIPPRVVIQTATTTRPSVTVATTTQPSLKATAGEAKKVLPKIIEKTVSKPTKKVTAQATTTPVVVKIPEPAPDFEKINTYARSATVNILCTAKGSDFSPISGTGVIISPEGVILTNAHIAEYFLLRNFRQKDFVECIIRTGSPAYPRYHAELVYISPTWVKNNKAVVKQQNPKGTGEYDFAFLRITNSINDSPLPKFSHITPNIREIVDKTEPVVLVSYPAEFLGGISITKDLNIASAVTTIQDFFTFSENTIDLISVGGTVVSQKGASGGPVVDRFGTVIGIISTSSDGKTTSERRLFAVTPAYINRTLQSEVGITLEQLLSNDTARLAKEFQENIAPQLTKILTDELTKQ